jgi:hypothetical protein
MNGSIRKKALGLLLGSSVSLAAGCVAEYRECVDPCWPERYNHMARVSVRGAFNTQAANGHVLDQTVWNQHFEVGTDKLNDAGKAHLKYLARRLPAPDPMVYVQPAYDLEGAQLDANALKDLSERRAVVVERYLSSMMTLRNMPVTFTVSVRDASEPGLPSRSASNLYVRPLTPAPNKTEFDRGREERLRAGATQVDVQNTGVQAESGPTSVRPTTRPTTVVQP